MIDTLHKNRYSESSSHKFNKNSEEDANASQLIASVRSEGEGIKHFDVSETDVEFCANNALNCGGITANDNCGIGSITYELSGVTTGTFDLPNLI